MGEYLDARNITRIREDGYKAPRATYAHIDKAEWDRIFNVKEATGKGKVVLKKCPAPSE